MWTSPENHISLFSSVLLSCLQGWGMEWLYPCCSVHAFSSWLWKDLPFLDCPHFIMEVPRPSEAKWLSQGNLGSKRLRWEQELGISASSRRATALWYNPWESLVISIFWDSTGPDQPNTCFVCQKCKYYDLSSRAPRDTDATWNENTYLVNWQRRASWSGSPDWPCLKLKSPSFGHASSLGSPLALETSLFHGNTSCDSATVWLCGKILNNPQPCT